MDFQSFAFSPAIRTGIAKAGFLTPTPIQEDAIPPATAGRDVLGLAQTGSGKTAAFVLPILERLHGEKNREPRALIIAPTRELVSQICDSVRVLGVGTELRHCAIFGGVSANPQISQLRRGVDIVVGCPGRLLDLLQQKVLSLQSIQTLVLDEADTLFDMGFLPSIKKILQHMPKSRQNLLFSATMPADIESLAQQILKQPVTIRREVSRPKESISQELHLIQQSDKKDLLFSLLRSGGRGSTIIFTRTKHRAKRLMSTLVESGFRATSLQGNLSQKRREEAMQGFRSGRYEILVATDIASRGIDVAEVHRVINFDAPSTLDAYTHRIGRTGRADRKGESHTFLTPEDEKVQKQIARMFPQLLPGGQQKVRAQTAPNKSHSSRENRRGRGIRKKSSPGGTARTHGYSPR